jgi:1-acyl-sn-glycerol-3-phosphate acyltransferase
MLRLPRFAARLTMWLGGVRVRVHGAQHLDRTQRYVFVGNHVSMFDAPVAAAAGVINARAFQESSHVKIPVYGGFVKMFDEVLVDWRDPASRQRAYQEALERVRSGWSFGVFPEGKRSYDGKLGPFYDGAFRLAIEAQVPIAPACFRGLRNICPPQEWRARPGVVDVIYGEPIPTAGLTLDDTEALKNQARRAINDLLREGPPA